MATSDCQWGHEVGWRAEVEHLGGKWRATKNEKELLRLFSFSSLHDSTTTTGLMNGSATRRYSRKKTGRECK